VPYIRPWKSFNEQLALLKSRGLVITDDSAALDWLKRVGYYRLSAYWYPYRIFQLTQDPTTGVISSKRQEQFIQNTHFLDAVELYLFDKKLRLLLTDALERIEVAIRVDIAHLLGERDTFAYCDQSQFHPTFSNRMNHKTGKSAFENWQDRYAGLVNRSKEDFVLHYRRTHGGDLPIWVAIELWDFGAMSQLFSLMKVPDQTKIAAKYQVTDFRVFASWLRSLNYLRNVVAHHSRTWNRNVIDQPKLPKKGTVDWCDHFVGSNDLSSKPFLLISIVRHLMLNICPNTEWNNRVRDHLLAFPNQESDKKRSISDMGTPNNWQTWW